MRLASLTLSARDRRERPSEVQDRGVPGHWVRRPHDRPGSPVGGRDTGRAHVALRLLLHLPDNLVRTISWVRSRGVQPLRLHRRHRGPGLFLRSAQPVVGGRGTTTPTASCGSSSPNGNRPVTVVACAHYETVRDLRLYRSDQVEAATGIEPVYRALQNVFECLADVVWCRDLRVRPPPRPSRKPESRPCNRVCEHS
jgi:hypothetical protein